MSEPMTNENAVILSFISNTKDNVEERSFLFDGIQSKAKEYRGTQTNEAPIRLLNDLAKNAGYKVSKVLCILTKEVYKEIDERKGKNEACEETGVRERHWLLQLLDEISTNGSDLYVPILFEKNGESDYSEILKQLSEHVTEGTKVYIDYTGGYRDISFLMTSIIRFLAFKGAKCEEIVYAKLGSPGSLILLDYAYNMYQLINGADTFVNTGNAGELKKAYKNYEGILKRLNQELSSGMDRVFDKIEKFSGALMLNDIGDINLKIENVVKALDQYSKLRGKEQNNVDVKIELFCTAIDQLIETIKRKLYLEKFRDGTVGDGYYKELIRWCLENKLIQQAAVLYIEKLPIYYFGLENFIPDDVKKKIKGASSIRGSNEKAALFYENVFDYFTPNDDPKKSEDKLKEIIKNILNKKVNSKKDYMEEFDTAICELKKEGGYSIVENRLSETREKIDSNFADNCGLLKNRPDKITQETVRKYLKSISNGKAGGESGLKKKISQIREAMQKTSNGKMSRAMMYYLAVKIIRNNMAHANEEMSEKEIADFFLNETNSKIEINLVEMDNYIKIIQEGLNVI